MKVRLTMVRYKQFPGFFNNSTLSLFNINPTQKFSYSAMKSKARGAFIVVEGVDKSGKSTQCKKLVESLKNQKIEAKYLNFPDRSTHIGKVIDEYLTNKCQLNDKTIHLLFSANRWESVEKIEKLLEEGCTLIVDRYSYSGIVFSAIKNGMDINWCKQPEIGLPKPDAVFLLTLSPEEMRKRSKFGEERYEKMETQIRVAELFHKLAKEEGNWEIIDAENTIEDIQANLLKKILQKTEEVKSIPLSYIN